MGPRGNLLAVLLFVAALALPLFLAPGSSGGPDPQGKGYLTATFYVA
jgi:hypothetical protein